MTEHTALVLGCQFCGSPIMAIPDLNVIFVPGDERTDAEGISAKCQCGSLVSLDYQSGALLQFAPGFLDDAEIP
jgi:hypothetical protein